MPNYTQNDITDLLNKMTAERQKLIHTAQQLSQTQANTAPTDAVGEEQWTPKEQLAHLWEMERSYIAWCRAALTHNGADVTSIRGQPVDIPIEHAPQHTVQELLDALQHERQATNAFIQSLRPQQFSNTASTQAFGQLTVMQWLRSFYRHDRMHNAQIQGRQSDYQPRYQSDQSRARNQRQDRIDQVAAQQTPTKDTP